MAELLQTERSYVKDLETCMKVCASFHIFIFFIEKLILCIITQSVTDSSTISFTLHSPIVSCISLYLCVIGTAGMP